MLLNSSNRQVFSVAEPFNPAGVQHACVTVQSSRYSAVTQVFRSAEQLIYLQIAVSLFQLSGTQSGGEARARAWALGRAPFTHGYGHRGPGMPALGAGTGPTPRPNLKKAVRGARRLKKKRSVLGGSVLVFGCALLLTLTLDKTCYTLIHT